MTDAAWKTENHTLVDNEKITEPVKEEDMVEEEIWWKRTRGIRRPKTLQACSRKGRRRV